MTKHSRFLDLVNESAARAPLGTGYGSEVFTLADARFARYPMKLYKHGQYDRDTKPTLAGLKETTALTPVHWVYEGRHFGQALLSTINYAQPMSARADRKPAYDMDILALQEGESTQHFHGRILKSQRHLRYQSALQYMDAIAQIPDDGLRALFDEIFFLSEKGIGIDLHPIANNLFYSPERLRLIDIPTAQNEGKIGPAKYNHVTAVYRTLLQPYGGYGVHSYAPNDDISQLEAAQKSLWDSMRDSAQNANVPITSHEAVKRYANIKKRLCNAHSYVGSRIRLADTPERVLETLQESMRLNQLGAHR